MTARLSILSQRIRASATGITCETLHVVERFYSTNVTVSATLAREVR